jgi:uncharacterized protein
LIVPDINVLLYGANENSAFYRQASARLEKAFLTEGVGLPIPVLTGFLRLATRPGILRNPLSVDQALGVIDYWANMPTAAVLSPNTKHLGVLGRLLLGLGRGGSIVSDADIAAYAICQNACLITFDKDFLQFSGLQVEVLYA